MSNDTPSSDFTPPSIEEISQLLPAYEIVSFIAKGGMGAVYKATQKSLDRPVAIKVLPRHFGEDESFRASFETEAKSMAKLNHPNLIGIYDFGQVDGLLYIIMEMVEGESLFHATHGKTLEADEAAQIILEICNGLANAHKHGILHRDIKPANILLDSSTSPKIGDFGLARPVADHEKDSAFGTPGYTAPEVIHNPTAVDHSTDLYAVGVMLYELLTGSIPPTPYVPVTQFLHCNPKFDEIIQKAINPIPALRFREAKEMAKALEPLTSKSAAHNPLLATNTRLGSPQAKNLNSPQTGPHTTTGLVTATNLKNTGSVPNHQVAGAAAQVGTGANTTLIRNIIIIIALLFAIVIAWEGYKKVKANRAEEQKIVDTEKAKQAEEAHLEKEKRQEEKRLARVEAARKAALARKPEAPEETAEESLARLKYRLLNGSRKEMPKGSIRKGRKYRFFIKEPMTWHQALAYCESHGGHLATLTDTTELDWLSSKIPSDQSVWLGAGSAGKNKWSWIDGSPWNLEIRDTSKASFVSVDENGILTPDAITKKHSFYIEWSKDGVVECSLNDQLKRIAQSFKSDTPSFPPGTISYNDNHYLIVEKNLNWKEANNLAKSAGGSLTVPSNSDENVWLIDFISAYLPEGTPIWIGAYREANSADWAWTTGEPWTFAKWGDNAPDAAMNTKAAAAIISGKLWEDYPGDEQHPYFIIKWSKAIQQVVQTSGEKAATPDDLAPLHKICKQRISKILKTTQDGLDKNFKGYERDLQIYQRSLAKSKGQDIDSTIKALLAACQNSYIPPSEVYSQMPDKIAKAAEYRIKKQKAFETTQTIDIEKLRISYHKELAKLIDKYNQSGLKAKVNTIKQEIASTNDHKTFVNRITGSSSSLNRPKTAKFRTVMEDGQITISKWTATASSVQPGAGAELAIDGDVNTNWHSKWDTSAAEDSPPFTLDISLGRKQKLRGVVLTPRNHGENGIIKDYAIYTSMSGTSWNKVKAGKLPRGDSPKYIYFPRTAIAKHVRVKVISSHSKNVASLAEFEILESNN